MPPPQLYFSVTVDTIAASILVWAVKHSLGLGVWHACKEIVLGQKLAWFLATEHLKNFETHTYIWNRATPAWIQEQQC